jgi:hypothetical protein
MNLVISVLLINAVNWFFKSGVSRSMKKFVISMSVGVLGVSLGSPMIAQAAVPQQPATLSSPVTVLAQADESALITENRALLISNRALARKIAAKLGITSTGDLPTSGSPLEQNQVLILQNQETFKAIAVKLGATVPELGKPAGKDLAEQNHNLLLQNRSIVVAILGKLGIAPASPPELTGSFVAKNNKLLLGNKATLEKIAAKLEVPLS